MSNTLGHIIIKKLNGGKQKFPAKIKITDKIPKIIKKAAGNTNGN